VRDTIAIARDPTDHRGSGRRARHPAALEGGVVTLAFKFLAAGAIGPFAQVTWPAIGSWLAGF